MPRFCPECGKRFDSDVTACPDDGSRTYSIVESGDMIGRQIDGRFTIRETLGKGGMGAVYRARQHSMDRDVAMKLLNRDRVQDEQAIKRFFRESRAASRLVNPHTITLFDFGQDPADGTFYIAMELLKGSPLTAHMGPCKGPVPVDRAVGIVLQVLESLEEAHEAGVIHRDLKPDNIFVLDHPPDFVKVLDFGIAKLVSSGTEQITGEGLTFGTPEYMSPEQAYGKPLDARSDLYSVAQILFELITGRAAYSGATSLDVVLRKVNEPVPRLRDVRPDIEAPPALEGLLVRLMDANPDNRTSSAAGVAALLREATGRDAPTVRGRVDKGAPTAGQADTVKVVPRESAELKGVLDMAEDLSRECIELFEDARSRVASEPAGRVVAMLLEEREEIADNLAMMRASIRSGDTGWSVVRRIGPLTRDMSGWLDQAMSGDCRDVEGHLMKLLDSGLALERKGAVVWEKKLPALREPQVLELARRLLGESRGRIATLAEMKLRVVGIRREAVTASLFESVAGLLPVKGVSKGTTIFRQGDPGDSMVIVVSGEFDLEVDEPGGGRSKIGKLGPGEILGDMSCLDPAPRSATVTAGKDSEVYLLDRGTLDALEKTHPGIYTSIVRGVISQLTLRIRETDQRIEDLFRKVRLTPAALPGGSAEPTGDRHPVKRIEGMKPSRLGSVGESELEWISRVGKARRFARGTVLCQEGEPGHSCFVLVRGQLKIVKWVDGTELELTTMVPGSIVGQIVLADGGRRSASIVAGGDVDVIELDRRTFASLVEENVAPAMRFNRQIAVSGIRQLRLANRWMALLMARARDEAAKPKAPVKPAASQAIPKSVPRPKDDDDANRRLGAYMRTALHEWGMSIDELDDVRVSIPDGQISSAELKARLKN